MNKDNENINIPAGTETPADGQGDTEGVNTGTYSHRFKKPFEYEGKKYSTLNFYFGNLTGRDMVSIETEMQARNEYALDPLISRSFQSKMAARAGGIGVDALEAMPIQEFNKIVNAARNFLVENSGA